MSINNFDITELLLTILLFSVITSIHKTLLNRVETPCNSNKDGYIDIKHKSITYYYIIYAFIAILPSVSILNHRDGRYAFRMKNYFKEIS